MMKLLAVLEEQDKTFNIALGLVCVGIIGIVDYVTGSELGFSIFYVLPILLVTWLVSQWAGYTLSLISAVIWLIADGAGPEFSALSLVSFWNSLIRFAFFVVITYLLSSLKSSLEQARTDPLTAAKNSRFFYEMVQMEMNRLHRTQQPFSVAYIDLDSFKAVNDTFGHNTGDTVLVTLVHSVSKVIRKTDFIARLGGDEFAILFPETDQEAAQIIFPKIQKSFLEAARRKNWTVTFSAGVLTCKTAPDTISKLIEMADELMYRAKADGRNTVQYSTYDN